ncbi:MAG: restriction endonuclease subunit S [Betaproteobacteria bacterium]|nr:restriction endonuclease subunit S [Betaproteobacteria bacterium]
MNIMLAWNRGLGVSRHYGIVSPAYSVFKPLPGSSPRFLDYMVRSDRVTLYFKAFSSGVVDSRLRLYPDIFGSMYCAMPTAVEQVAIADFLDRETAKIDALIAEQEKLIALLAEKRQATISHAVTRGLDPDVPMKDSGVQWLGEVPAHWQVVRLKFVASVQTGIAKGKDTAGKDVRTVPYIRVANVQDGYLALQEIATIEVEADLVDRYLLKPGDVLMNEGGDFDKLGRGAVWNGEIEGCIHQNHVFAVRPRTVSPAWLDRVTSTPYAQFYFMTRSKQSTNLASISSSNIMELPVLLPPAGEQNQILAFIDEEARKLDALGDDAERAITLLRERRAALITATVTGQIDVRGLVADTVPQATALEPASA